MRIDEVDRFFRCFLVRHVLLLLAVFEFIHVEIFAGVRFLSGCHVFLALQFVSVLFFNLQFCTLVTERVGVLKCRHTDYR